jgi:serine/threonine protein kinase
MVPPPDETPESLGDGVTGSDVGPPEDSSAQSIGEGVTGSDVGPAADSSPQSIGEELTSGDFDSELEEFGGVDPLDFNEIVDLESRYEIIEVLGRGGMGEVLKAKDKRLSRMVAIKRMLGEVAQSKQAARRFLTEAQSVAQAKHVNIVDIYEMERSEEGPYIVMEYVEGGSLGDWLQGGALELSEAVDVIAQVCDGLQKAHDAGIVHRDIKPDNILMTLDGTPKLGDFGLARQETVDGGKTQAGVMLGTLDFMSREQKEDASQADARSDQWSLAATLYQVTTGESPRVIDLDDVPETIRGVLQQALKGNPASRYESVKAFGHALRKAMLDETAPSATTDGLQQGQCPKCGMNNELSSKFCMSCSESLREPCLNCDEEIGVWVTYCTQCRRYQLDLAKAKSDEYEEQKKTIAGLRVSCRFDEAKGLAAGMSEESNSRLTAYAKWAATESEAIAEESKQRVAERDASVKEARRLVQEDQLEEAVRTLEQIPEALQNRAMEKLQKEIEAKNADLAARVRELVEDAESLKQQVEVNAASQDYTAAIRAAETLADRPERELAEYVPWAQSRVEGLKETLAEWEQKRAELLEEAEAAHKEDQFETAIDLLDQVPSSLVFDPVTEIGDESVHARRVGELLQLSRAGLKRRREIEDLQAQFRDLQSEIPSMRGEYRHAEALLLLEQMIERDEQELSEYRDWGREQHDTLAAELKQLTDEAQVLLKEALECRERYADDEGISLLERIAEPLRNDAVTEALEGMRKRVASARRLRKGISESVANKEFDALERGIERYLEIRPDDAAVKRLSEKVDKRREQRQVRFGEVVDRALEQLLEARYDKAISLLERIPTSLRRGSSRTKLLLKTCRSGATLRTTALAELDLAPLEERIVNPRTGSVGNYRTFLHRNNQEGRPISDLKFREALDNYLNSADAEVEDVLDFIFDDDDDLVMDDDLVPRESGTSHWWEGLFDWLDLEMALFVGFLFLLTLIPAVAAHLAFVFLGWLAVAVVFCLVAVIMTAVFSTMTGDDGAWIRVALAYAAPAVMWAVIVVIHVWVFGSDIWSIRWQELTGWF